MTIADERDATSGQGPALGPLTDVVSGALRVILFGSRAAGVASDSSDWDVLCVGDGAASRAGGLDVVWVTWGHFASESWLASELGGHVATYGRSLRGPEDWCRRARPGAEAMTAKRNALAARASSIEFAWPDLTPGYRAKHMRFLRRATRRGSRCSQRESPFPDPDPGP